MARTNRLHTFKMHMASRFSPVDQAVVELVGGRKVATFMVLAVDLDADAIILDTEVVGVSNRPGLVVSEIIM